MTSPIFVPSFPAGWTTTSINSSSVANNGTATTATIDNNLFNYTQVSVTCAYGSPATAGLLVYVLADIDGTNFQAVGDNPWGIQLPVTASTTIRAAFTVDARDVRKFQILVSNASGSSATVTVRYQQVTITQN